jgi:hypothetical protein
MLLLPIIIAEIVVGSVAMVAMMAGQTADDNWIPVVVICALGLVLCAANLGAIWRRDRRAVLYNAYFYMLLASAFYFFIGPLVYVFGPEPAVAYVISQYTVNAADAVWLTGAHLLAIGIIGAAYLTVPFEGAYRWSLVVSRSYARLSVTRILVPLLLVCLVLKYLIILPADFSLSDEAISAPVRLAQQFISFSLYIVFARASAGQRAWLPWAIALLVSEIATGLLTFNKSSVLIAMLFAGLGWLSKRVNWKSMLGGGLVLLVALELLTPLATYGRATLSLGEGYSIRASFGDRATILQSYLAESAYETEGSNAEGMSWVRLNYMPTQKAAMDLYDDGLGGNDWELIAWLFIPRFLYPDKPIITSAGPILYEKMTGQVGSSVAPGILMDGYYNSGLLGVVVISILLGLSLSFYTAIGRGIIEGGSDLMYPLVAFGIYRGLRIDGTILADVIGPLLIFGVLLAVVAFLEPGRHRFA